jgi:hypothetical protein
VRNRGEGCRRRAVPTLFTGPRLHGLRGLWSHDPTTSPLSPPGNSGRRGRGRRRSRRAPRRTTFTRGALVKAKPAGAASTAGKGLIGRERPGPSGPGPPRPRARPARRAGGPRPPRQAPGREDAVHLGVGRGGAPPARARCRRELAPAAPGVGDGDGPRRRRSSPARRTASSWPISRRVRPSVRSRSRRSSRKGRYGRGRRWFTRLAPSTTADLPIRQAAVPLRHQVAGSRRHAPPDARPTKPGQRCPQ